MKLSVKGFALTCGILMGLGMLLMTWWIILIDGSSTDPISIGKIYRGYNFTPLGSVIGLGWGLLDGLICGAIFAGLYNCLSGKPKDKELSS